MDPYLGSGKTVINYSKGLSDRGWEVVVFEPSNYEWLPRLGRLKKLRQALGALIKVRRYLQANSPDIVEFFGDEFWLVVWFLKKRKARPLVVAHTNGLELCAYSASRQFPGIAPKSSVFEGVLAKVYHQLSKFAFSASDRFVCLSSSDYNFVLDSGFFSKETACVVGPGLDEEFLGKPYKFSRDNTIVFNGSWIERKDPRTIWEVMNVILKMYPDYRFVLMGCSGHKDRILGGFHESVRERVDVKGRLTTAQMVDQISKAKIFFFPSIFEGFGIATAEAMACGCAVVTTPTGLGAELTHGINGMICSFRDVSSMTEAISKLVSDDEHREKIARNALDYSQRFVWKEQCNKLSEQYRRWIGCVDESVSSQT